MDECKLRIRFDDASAKIFTMGPSSDQSSKNLFARYPEWAIKKLKNANRIFVQVPMYREGNQLLEFRTDKVLIWPPADSSDISQATSSNDLSKGVEPTKAEQSSYNSDISQATTSSNLSKADLAWHAQNTYGWDCEEVVSREDMTTDDYFFITCSSGKKLRVYLRQSQHPKIMNESGGWGRD